MSYGQDRSAFEAAQRMKREATIAALTQEYGPWIMRRRHYPPIVPAAEVAALDAEYGPMFHVKRAG